MGKCKTKPKSTNETRKEGLKKYADMTIYALDPARLVPTMCHHKLPTTIVTSLILSNYLIPHSLSVAKMHAACSRLPHNQGVVSPISIILRAVTEDCDPIYVWCRCGLLYFPEFYKEVSLSYIGFLPQTLGHWQLSSMISRSLAVWQCEHGQFLNGH